MIPLEWLHAAAERIAPHIKPTPLTYDPENDIYIKWENQQVTGSFKARGALNKILGLSEWERQRGLVTASAGNHGQGVALAAQITGAKVLVFASEHASPAKLVAMRALGAEVRLSAGGYGEAEAAALQYAQEAGATWVSPYNDGQVIAGQGTLGLEIYAALPQPVGTTWIIPVGGGGLAAGIGASLEGRPGVRLAAAQSDASPFMHALYYQGSQEGVVELPSLADGLAGPVEHQSLTIPLLRNYIQDFVLVHEQDIAHALRYCWQQYHERIEGSAAVALAAVLTGKVNLRPAVVVVSGGNISQELFEQLVGDLG
jgi:threonine dehydratase